MKNNFRFLTKVISIVTLFGLLSFQNYAFTQDKNAEIDKLITTCHKYGLVNGTVLVAEKGKVIYKKTFGIANAGWDIPHQIDSKFFIYSMSKQFTAMLIMQLVEEGKVKLDGKLSDYLPYYRKDTGEKVTIHHLLTHTHGIPRLEYTELPLVNTLSSKDFIVKYLSKDLEFEPGSKFNYSGGFDISAAIIEEVTGKTYEEVLTEKILKPLNMKNTGVRHTTSVHKKLATAYRDSLDIKREPFYEYSCNGGSAIYSTVDDLYLWDRALYTDKLLSKKYRDIMIDNHVEARAGYYAYGWDITIRAIGDTKKKFVWHGGGGSTMIFRSIQDQHLVILLNNKTQTQTYRICNAIMNILYDQPYEIPKVSIVSILIRTINEKNVEAGIKQYWELKKKHPVKYAFGEYELNGLGYYLLRDNKIPEAIEIFKLNVKVFPNAWNVYDSLGEAYMKNGDTELAIKNYEKAKKFNPQKTQQEKGAYKLQVEILKKLKGGK